MHYEAFAKPFSLLSDSRRLLSLAANASASLAWACAILSLSSSTIANTSSMRASLTLNFRSVNLCSFPGLNSGRLRDLPC